VSVTRATVAGARVGGLEVGSAAGALQPRITAAIKTTRRITVERPVKDKNM
jgi:hypothetical protein